MEINKGVYMNDENSWVEEGYLDISEGGSMAGEWPNVVGGGSSDIDEGVMGNGFTCV